MTTASPLELRLRRCLLVLLTIGVASQAWGATTVVVGTDPAKQVVRGTIVTPTATIQGELVIEGDTISCVAVTCVAPAGASIFQVTDGYIYPGFVDAHNHVAYNVLPKWTPPKLYQNRGQWQSTKAYQAFKQPYSDLKDRSGLYCEMVKWGEIKALISGITTIQGTSPNQNCFWTLVRNAENQNELGTSGARIRTFILDISSFRDTIDWQATQAFVIHLAEGVDDRSRAEFQTLKQKGLLRAQTAIIHGTAFGDAEFAEMGRIGAKLIWSPQSNRVLYGQTTKIPLAREHGVSVSVGIDWNPTGSDDLFDELRVAADFNHNQFADAIPEDEWVSMITVNPAKALALDAFIGALAPGHKADITVVGAQGPNPNRSILANHPQDVELVWIGGEVLYGTASVVQKVKPGKCEALSINGADKRVCVKDDTHQVEKSTQSLADIRRNLLAKYPQLAPLVR